MPISKENVKYVAALARLDVPEERLEGFVKNLKDIVHYVEQLQKLNVEGIQPTTHAVPVGNVFRPDEAKPSLPHQEALSMAIESKDSCFKVPIVIE